MKHNIITLSLLGCCAMAAAQNTEVQYLSGRDASATVEWKFFCSAGQNSGKWRKIAVPSCWEQQGFGEYTYGRWYKKPGGKPSTETGRYRHEFRVPAAWQGKKVEIVFDGVMTDATVSVNGKTAGPTHRGAFTRFAYDISRLIDYGGKNTLEVTVKKQSDDSSVNNAERRADWWLFGGIYRPVYLRALPKTHIAHTGIDAKADGTLTLDLTTEGLADGYKLAASISPLQSQAAQQSPQKSVSLSSGKRQRVALRFDGVKPWDPEHPNMYVLTLSLVAPDGSVTHRTSERVGFRTIEFRPRDGFYLNGTKLNIKGVNRHCFYPETGRTPDKRRDIADVRLIKGMNANAIRSHYPPGSPFLDICDSLGVLYFNELPGWQNHYSTATGTQILGEMMAAEANHPCIFVWGNGNEGGNNLKLDPLFAELDPQRRHVVHPWALWNGVDCHHYPAYQTGAGRLHNGTEVFMPTEFLHSQYDKGGGASLDEYWAQWSRNPLFAGGFIWAWADEGVMRTDRGDSIDTDGPNAPDGIVGPHREKEGSWYTIRDVWSPIQIAPMTVRPQWDGRFKVANRFLFSRLTECSMSYSVTTLPSPASDRGRTVAEGTVALPDIAPGETGTAAITLPESFAEGDVLTLVATTAAGDTINTWAYPMRYADEYYALAKPAAVAGRAATADGTTLEGGGVRAEFNPDDGMLKSVTVDGKAFPLSNGPLPVGMKMKLKGITARQEGADALLVMRYQGAADSIVWRMTPAGVLGMDAVILNRRDGGKFGGEFFDPKVRNLGFSFSYPEEAAKGVRWVGKGPYRVWRNRLRGPVFGLWQKDYNNTVTGEGSGRLDYPEFKGYHANVYWAEMQSDTAPFKVYSETDGLYLRLFTPEEPKHRNERTMQPFPEVDISFLFEIPGMRSYKPIEQLGPEAQPSGIRINKGDDGLRIKLWFDFR